MDPESWRVAAHGRSVGTAKGEAGWWRKVAGVLEHLLNWQ